MENDLAYIHIGKAAGSSLGIQLRNYYPDISYYHHKRDYDLTKKYILFIRNPLTRFVSAFNYSYHMASYDCYMKTESMINESNCLAPDIIIDRIKNKRNFSRRYDYDNLLLLFKTPNNLGESLSSPDFFIKKHAEQLMTYNFENICHNIGWYLFNGNFIKYCNGNILFVGKQETYRDDVIKLGKILDKSFDLEFKNKKNNFTTKESKYLSPLAIKNLIEFYKDKDYAALIELKNYSWITQETLDSYYQYSP